MKEDQGEVPHGKKPSPRRLRNWSIDFAVSLLIVLPIGKLFEFFASKDELEHLLHFQERLHIAVSNLDPGHLFGYLFIPYDYLRPHLDHWLSSFLSGSVVNTILQVLGLPLLALGLGLLPITVLLNGTLLEVFLVVGLFYPMAYLLSGGKWEAGGVILAFIITLLCFWVMKMVMLAALHAFGGILHSAQALVGSTFMTYAIYWCAVRGTEHSLTERALHAAFRRLS